MSQRTPPAAHLPPRASLENLRKQAKALHRAFTDGDAVAVDRIRQYLPRADALVDGDVSGFGLSLQEAQHALSKEYGCASWDDLRAIVEMSFDAIADLHKSDLQEVLRQTELSDWVRALSAMPERVREGAYCCMSLRVVRFITAEILALDATPAEVEDAQHAILDRIRQVAAEKGFAWPPVPALTSFADLARLTDRDAQELLREVSQKDLCRALIGAPESVRGLCLGNMSRRVRTAILEEGERLADDLPAHEPEASRQRVLEWAEVLGRDARIAWPPSPDRPLWSGPLVDPSPGTGVPGHRRAFDDLDVDDLVRILSELATLPKEDWVSSLEGVVGYPEGPLGEGLRLAADGTEAGLVENLLRTRAQTMVRNHRLWLRMMQEGMAALQAGTNPRLLFREMQAHYLDPDVWEPPKRSKEDLTGAALRDWLEREWLTIRKPAEIAELFLHLGFVARNEGRQALAVAASAIELPLLRDGLEAVAGAGSTPVALQQKMTATIEADVAVLAGRLSANLAGILGVMAGSSAAQVAAAMHEAAAAHNDS